MVSLKFFLTQGYENTTLSMIADAVDIKKPSIYYHFKSKEDLLFNCIDLILNSLEDQITNSIINSVNPKDRIHAFFECLLDFNSNLSTILEYNFEIPVNLILFFQMSANRFSELSNRINEYYNKISNILNEIIVEGQQKGIIKNTINTDVVIIDIISRIEGIITLSFIYKSVDIDKIRKQLFEKIWISLLNEQSLSTKRKFIDYSKIDLGRKW